MVKDENDAKKIIEAQWAELKSSLKNASPNQMAGLINTANALGAQAAAAGFNIDVSSFDQTAEFKEKEYETKIVFDRDQEAKHEMQAKEAAEALETSEKKHLIITQNELKEESVKLTMEHKEFNQYMAPYLEEIKKDNINLDELIKDLETGKPVNHKTLQERLPLNSAEEIEKKKQKREKLLDHHDEVHDHHGKAHDHNDALEKKASTLQQKINANPLPEELAKLQTELEHCQSQLEDHKPVIEKAKEKVAEVSKKVEELKAKEDYKEKALESAHKSITARNPAELHEMRQHIEKCQEQHHEIKGKDREKKGLAVKAPDNSKKNSVLRNQSYAIGNSNVINPPTNTPHVAINPLAKGTSHKVISR